MVNNNRGGVESTVLSEGVVGRGKKGEKRGRERESPAEYSPQQEESTLS